MKYCFFYVVFVVTMVNCVTIWNDATDVVECPISRYILINATVETPCDSFGILELRDSTGRLIEMVSLQLKNVLLLDRLVQGSYSINLVSSKAYCKVISSGFEFVKTEDSCIRMQSMEFEFHLSFNLDQFLLDHHPHANQNPNGSNWQFRFALSFAFAFILTTLFT